MKIRKLCRDLLPDCLLNIYRKIKFEILKIKWRKINKHNGTNIVCSTNINRISVGNYSYGDLDVLASPNTTSNLKIGNFCCIASGVKFLLSGNHLMSSVSTFPFEVRLFGKLSEDYSKGDIIVGDDVWFGQRSMIMSGVKIGQGAVVAAGSVVTKDVPPYAVVAGNPAVVKRYRFSDEIIEELLTIDYSKWNEEFCYKNLDALTTIINDSNYSKIISELNRSLI